MGKNNRNTATIWAPLAEVRISERRRRSINQATVERYRQWLEQGREAPPVRLAREETPTSFVMVATESLRPWPQDTLSSRRNFNG